MLYDQVTPRPNVWKANISAIQECATKTNWLVDTSISVEEAWSVFKAMSSYPYNSTSELRQKMTGLRRQLSHPHLNKFKEAKKELASIYEDILGYVSESHTFTREQSEGNFSTQLLKLLPTEERFVRLIGQGVHAEVEHHLQKIRNIQEIIARNQMKCAFFGRTSNGKSTVINAMLGSKLLPSGLGHTTSCFLEIQGTDQDSGYLLMADSDTNAKETSDISHQV
ncbi:unnamed protein product [Schistosoma margrebowiei]|uniref:Uncharacterized protein n=1 Tax=Schistosoma margrebowiei TaxID=48269 RepID=A0A183M3V7_9TREM|nr:unnamed protein product [Schistosoma margrebowiei]